jgi:aldose 1-epimerase
MTTPTHYWPELPYGHNYWQRRGKGKYKYDLIPTTTRTKSCVSLHLVLFLILLSTLIILLGERIPLVSHCRSSNQLTTIGNTSNSSTIMRSFSLLTALLCTAVAALPQNGQPSSLSIASASQTTGTIPSNTSTPDLPGMGNGPSVSPNATSPDAGNNNSTTTPSGFVNNGTVGSFPCVEGTAPGNQIAFLSGSYASACPDALQPVYPYNKINIRSPDDSIRATFLPYGASLQELWVKDRNGTWRDVVVGFDNTTNYGTDTIHNYFGPQVGRYANRIKNGTFEINGTTYHTPLNENNIDTLHGGKIGYDRRSHSVEHMNASAVSFLLHDADGNQGFPGSVVARAFYALDNNGTFNIQMDANVTDDKSTPIMLSHHVYWALHGYAGQNDTILNHTLHMPQADKYIKTDGILIPTGEIPSVTNTPYDFQTARTFNERFNETEGVCGTGCQGWDSCFVMSEHDRNSTILTLSSPETGIKLEIKTDQDAIQVYTCDGVSSPTKGSLPRKRVHGGDGTLDKVYENHSCVVLEMEDYIDGINNPEWKRDQIYSKQRPYHWRAEYTFSSA